MRILEVVICWFWSVWIRITFLWMWFLAFYRIDMEAVCLMAKLGYDYHDFPDSQLGIPEHFIPHTCSRCGKDFWI